MRILDKYIFKKVISSYLFILLVFAVLYLIGDLFSNLSDIFKTKPPVSILLQYYLNMLPLIFSRVSPFSILISVLHTLGELNQNNEILSMRASGISIFKISLPIITFALFISFAALNIQERMLLPSQKKVEDIKVQFIKKTFSLVNEEKNLAFFSNNMTFFVRSFLPRKNILRNVTIFKEGSEKNIEKKMVCRQIRYQEGKWMAKDILEYTLNPKGEITGMPVFLTEREINLAEKPHELLFKKSIFVEFSPLKSLQKDMKRYKKIKANDLLADTTIKYHQKLADPFSHLFLVIGILPIAMEIKKRKVTLSSLGVGLIFGFIYYISGSFSIALGKSGFILPVFSAWLPPLFFLTVGITGLILIR